MVMTVPVPMVMTVAVLMVVLGRVRVLVGVPGVAHEAAFRSRRW